MISGYPQFTRGQCPITQVPALQALLACEHRFTKPVLDREPNHQLTIKRKRSVVRNGGDNQHEGLANPHPQSIVNGTNREREVARPTVAGTPHDLPKPVLIPPPNPFSWSAKSPAKQLANSGGMLLAGTPATGRRAAIRPQPVTGAAPACGA